MKKSTVFAILGILGLFLTISATNLKLKQEYTRGNIRNPYVERTLPAFSYIKETLKPSLNYAMGITIKDQRGQKPKLSVYFNEPDLYRFHVENDTLFISNSNSSEGKINIGESATVFLFTDGLKKIITTNGIYNITEARHDSLSLIASGKSQITIQTNNMNGLTIKGSDISRITLSGTDTINHANIELKNFSSLNISQVRIKQKKIQIAKEASLQLSGGSLDDFGIQRN